MLLPALALLAGLHAPVRPDTCADSVAVYAAVLADVRARANALDPQPRIILNEAKARQTTRPPWPATEFHPAPTIAGLAAAGAIQGTCRPGGERNSCARYADSRTVFVRIGSVIRLPDTTTVSRTEPYFGHGAADGSQERVPASFAVDVVLDWPCPNPCRNANVSMYRYYMRQTAPGRYVVATRWNTGAA